MKSKQTVLIADDIPDNLNIAAEALMKNGLNIIFAQTGKEAIKFAVKFIPDLILLDIMMPGITGYEVCEILKKNETTKEIPVIFLTALNETENIIKGFKLGAVDYINKPFITEELISRVLTHLKIFNQKKQLQKKEKEIKESEAKLSAVINSIPDFIFYKDIKSKYTGLNKAFAEFMGENPKNVIGKTDLDFYEKEEAQIFLESDKHIIQTGENIIYEEWLKDKTGKDIYLYTKKAPLINCDGDITGVVGVSRNITELKIAEKVLKENQEKLQNIYNNANEGIFVIQNNKVAFLNKKLCEITGFSKEELKKRYFLEFIHKNDQKEVAEYYQKKLTGIKIGKSIVFRIINKKNNIKYVKVNTKLITWEENNAILVMLDDVTEQYLLEKDLKISRERLKLSQKAGKIGAWEWDLKTKKIRCSDMTFELIGINKNKRFINQDDFLKLIHPEDWERLSNEMQNKFNTKLTEYRTDYRIIKKNNECRWIEEISEITYNKNNNPVKMIGVLQDITDRKKADMQKQYNLLCCRNKKVLTTFWKKIISFYTNRKILSAEIFTM